MLEGPGPDSMEYRFGYNEWGAFFRPPFGYSALFQGQGKAEMIQRITSRTQVRLLLEDQKLFRGQGHDFHRDFRGNLETDFYRHHGDAQGLDGFVKNDFFLVYFNAQLGQFSRDVRGGD